MSKPTATLAEFLATKGANLSIAERFLDIVKKNDDAFSRNPDTNPRFYVDYLEGIWEQAVEQLQEVVS